MDEYTLSQIKSMLNKYVVSSLVKYNKLCLEDACKLWYSSKTKRELLDSEDPMLWVSPARCYDELMMEIENNPRWLKGQFE